MKKYLWIPWLVFFSLLLAACKPSVDSVDPGNRQGRPPDVDRAVEIVDRCIQAHGGIEAWRALQDVHYRERRVRFAGARSGRGESVSPRDIYLKRNRSRDLMVRIEISGGELEQLGPDGFPGSQPLDGTVIMGYDGREFWEIHNGKRVTEAEILKSTRFVTMAWRYWFCIPFVLKDRGVRLQYKGEETLDGKPVHLVEATFDPGTGDNPEDRYLYFIHRETYRVENLRYWMKNRPRPREFRMQSYVPLAGFLHDTLRLYYDDKGVHDGTKEMEILSVNSGLSDDLFHPENSHAGAPAP